jgi:hypothetical protein
MFGRTVFGDATSAMNVSASRPVDVSSSGLPINANAPQSYPVSSYGPNALAVGRPSSVYPGTTVGVDRAMQVSERIPQQVPIRATSSQQLVVPPMSSRAPGPGGIVASEQAAWNAWIQRHMPGIFHRPPLVGPGRYSHGDGFGPPSLGTSPDGLGRFRR